MDPKDIAKMPRIKEPADQQLSTKSAVVKYLDTKALEDFS